MRIMRHILFILLAPVILSVGCYAEVHEDGKPNVHVTPPPKQPDVKVVTPPSVKIEVDK
jgi:hypothetical protein